MSNKPNIWIFSLEPLETRYTCQWFTAIPEEMSALAGDKFNVHQINGVQKNSSVTEGAFLNFSDTNYWKSSQLLAFLEKHNAGETTPNDKFLFTDFWNPTITQLKYMKDLMGLSWEFHGIMHAGNYDPQDFLGRIKDPVWANLYEQSLYHSFDHLYVATEFHKKLFAENALRSQFAPKIKVSGQPHSNLLKQLGPFKGVAKRNLVLFPHRLAPEKQPEIFRDLASSMPEYEFVVCQDKKLTKDEYHQLLSEAKIVFSANLQETLGISAMEGIEVAAIPILPDRLSYSEMYLDEFLHPSEWTESWASYVENKDNLIKVIKDAIENYDSYVHLIAKQEEILKKNYLNASVMYQNILK